MGCDINNNCDTQKITPEQGRIREALNTCADMSPNECKTTNDRLPNSAMSEREKAMARFGVTPEMVNQSNQNTISGTPQKVNPSDRYATNVSGQHAYDLQGNYAGSKLIKHGENGNTIDLSKASQYRQEGAWIKGPDGSNIGPAQITVGEGKQLNLMDLIKGNLRQEGAWLKDKVGNVLCATNDPKFMQYRNLYGKGKV